MQKYPFTPEILDAMPEYLARLYRNLELTLLRNIADRLTATGELNEVTLQNIRSLRSHGMSEKEIIEEIQKTAKISGKELDRIIKDVVKRNQAYYTELIDLSNLTEPEVLVDLSTIAAISKQTQKEFRNLTKSMGFLVDSGRTMLKPAKAYQWALDNAIVQVQSGSISYNQAIANATRQLADSGLISVDYESGHRDSVDVAIRRATLTGITQICDKYTDESMEYLGTRYVEISAHSGARDKPYPNPWSSHKDWQGKVYYESENGETDPLGKYPDLVLKTGYGFVDGLCGANCRHIRHPFIPGIMERTYTDKELADIDPPPFSFDGKVYTYYEATQMQRSLERTIRKWKRREAAAVNPKDKETAQVRIRVLTEKYKEFSKAAGLRTQMQRANVYFPKR